MRRPDSGLSFPLALRDPGASPFLGAFGMMLAFAAFIVVVPLTMQFVIGMGFLLSGGGDWGAYQAAATSYEIPLGPAAANLGLATLIPLSLLLVRYLHRVPLPWVFSVQPGFRMRYGLIVLVVAAVVLNGAVWLGYLLRGMPTFHAGQDGWGWFVLAVLCTSPLQAAAEEVFFRGYLLQALGSASGNAWVGVVGSAVVFALLHGAQSPALFAHRLAFGLIAGALVVATGGLEAGIAAHVVNNLGAYGYALFTSSLVELRALREISWADALIDIAGFAIFAVIAWWVGSKVRLAILT